MNDHDDADHDRNDDDAIRPEEAARIAGVSTGHLANLRCKGGGPPYFKTGGDRGRVLYIRRLVKRWRLERTHLSTSSYRTTRAAGQPKPAPSQPPSPTHDNGHCN